MVILVVVWYSAGGPEAAEQCCPAGEASAPRLSSLLSGSNKKQVESCTRRCVPTCIRGGEGMAGAGAGAGAWG